VRRHHPQDQEPHSRVIRPGGEPEWVSVVHSDGSISEVRISADHDELTIGMWPAVGKPPHLSGYD
jgi:hypothetical protein